VKNFLKADVPIGLLVLTGALKHLLRWAALAFVLHGLWEVAQLPLYTLWDDMNRQRVVLYLLHCLAGDVLIASTLFLLAAAFLRDFAWPDHRPWRGGIIIIVIGVVFTGFSEWYNVYQTQAWSYAEAMPLVFGIGLTPLLQWIVVSALMVAIVGHCKKPA
jgi:hypothetical protein